MGIKKRENERRGVRYLRAASASPAVGSVSCSVIEPIIRSPEKMNKTDCTDRGPSLDAWGEEKRVTGAKL